MGRAPLIGGFFDLFQGRRVSWGEGQSDFPVSAIFSNSFSLKYLYAKVPYLGVGVACSEPPQKQVDVGRTSQSLGPNLTHHDF